MDIERKQSAFIDRFVRQAAELRSAESVVNLVLESRLPPIPLFSPSPWMCFSCLPAAHGKITIELPYDQLMEELDVSSVRELEEFLIKECIHTVQFAAGRDLTAEHLDNTIEASNIWFCTSSSLLHLIEERINWAECLDEINNLHKEDINDKIEVEKAFKDYDLQACNGCFGDFDEWSETRDGMDEDCIGRKTRYLFLLCTSC